MLLRKLYYLSYFLYAFVCRIVFFAAHYRVCCCFTFNSEVVLASTNPEVSIHAPFVVVRKDALLVGRKRTRVVHSAHHSQYLCEESLSSFSSRWIRRKQPMKYDFWILALVEQFLYCPHEKPLVLALYGAHSSVTMCPFSAR